MIVEGVSILLLAGMFMFGAAAVVGGARELFWIPAKNRDVPQGVLMLTTGLLFVGGVLHHAVLQVFW